MTWLWIALAALVAVAGLLYRARLRSDARAPRVDDEAMRRILEEGTLPAGDDDDSLDEEEAARAEEEFWKESWDEPEEFRP